MLISKANYNLHVITGGEGSRQEKGKRKEGWKKWDRKSRRDESSDDSEDNKESASYIDVSCLLAVKRMLEFYNP